MNNDLTKGHLRVLRDDYENACKAYLFALAIMWDWDCKSYGNWVGDDVGGVYVYGDEIFINMDDIRYVVNNNISCKTYEEWTEYCIWAHEFGQNVPNLKSWCGGCPRVDEDTRKRLSAMRKELNEKIEETKSKF